MYGTVCPVDATHMTQCSVYTTLSGHDTDVGIKCGEGWWVFMSVYLKKFLMKFGVCLSMCLLNYYLTYGASVCPENAVTFSAGNEGQKICGVLPETTALKSYAAKHERN